MKLSVVTAPGETQVIISHTIPFDDVNDALKTATTPGAADKVVVTFN